MNILMHQAETRGLRSLRKLWFSITCAIFLGAAAHAATITVRKIAKRPTLHPLTMRVGGRMEVTAAPDNRNFGAKNYTYQWPGSYFRAGFRGNQVFFRIVKGHEILHIMVDGRQRAVLVKPAAGIYEVDGLGKGKHKIGVYVATEMQAGPNTFGGFALPSGEKALHLRRRNRQIEFIGDSYTVGFGNLSSTRVCTKTKIWADTDDILAFGPRTARHYNADYQVNAISGRGVVRNYNGFKADTVPEAYPYVLFNRKQQYNNPDWKPQVIVIGLGTNDFSTPLHAGERWKTRTQLYSDYDATYLKFLKQLRERNPHAYMIVWAADVDKGEVEAQAQKVVEKMKKQGYKNITFLAISGLHFTACDSHPSLTDDKTISEKLIHVINSHKDVWERQ